MHNQWVKAGPSLGGKNTRDRVVVARIRTQSIDGLRRERDESAIVQALSRTCDSLIGCGQGGARSLHDL